MAFPVVLHEYRAFAHHLEVGPFPSDYFFLSVPGPFFRNDEELGLSREVVYLFKNNILQFTCFILHVQDCGYYPLGLDEPPDYIEFCVVPLF